MNFSSQSLPPVIAIAGPTAVGKSALALALWREFESGFGGWSGAELVNVDSAQIYRGMDIGTAKPDAETQAVVRHHLIDILDPAEAYSAARFADDASAVIADIRQRGKAPILVGGTMFYFRALFEGLNELPSADPVIRAELEAEAERDGPLAQHARLAAIDPATAARLHPNDRQRVQRALEIHALNGRAPSQMFAAPKPTSRVAAPYHRFALMPKSREGLNQAIAARFRAMLEGGLVEEVRSLHARGDLNLEMPSVRAVGYRQLWRYLDGDCTLAEAETLGVVATRQYAKRQLTWLRGDTAWQQLSQTEPFPPIKVLKEAIA